MFLLIRKEVLEFDLTQLIEMLYEPLSPGYPARELHLLATRDMPYRTLVLRELRESHVTPWKQRTSKFASCVT